MFGKRLMSSVVLVVLALFLLLTGGGILALGMIFLGLMFVYVFSFPKFRAEQVMTTFFCAFYAPVLFTFIFLTRNLPNGIYMVWMIFISSWI